MGKGWGSEMNSNTVYRQKRLRSFAIFKIVVMIIPASTHAFRTSLLLAILGDTTHGSTSIIRGKTDCTKRTALEMTYTRPYILIWLLSSRTKFHAFRTTFTKFCFWLCFRLFPSLLRLAPVLCWLFEATPVRRPLTGSNGDRVRSLASNPSASWGTSAN